MQGDCKGAAGELRTVIIRNMQQSDVLTAVEWTVREGWSSETEHVFRAFLGYDPGGCLIGVEDERPVAMCVAVAYGGSGFLGELIVVPDRRGRGLGRQLLEHAIGYLRSRGCESIYLDGEDLAVPLYERLGFRHVCDSCRFYGRVAGRRHAGVRTMKPADIDVINRFDEAAFGADRRFFLEYRLKQFPDLCRVLVADGNVSGYCMGQPGHGVVTVGPWVVVDRSGVRPLDLVESLALETGDTTLRIGVLESNARALEELRAVSGLEERGPCRRMVLGPDPGLGASEALYAIGSAAKG